VQQSKDRTTIDVLRHRLTTLRGRVASLGGRTLAALRTERGLTAGVVAVAAAGVVAAGGVAAGVGSGQPASSALTTTVATADRHAAADKADRSARTTPATGAQAGAQAAAKAPAKAAAAPKAGVAKPAAKPAAKKVAAPKPPWVTPMGKFELTSCFGPRWGTAHQGIDFANVAGTPIRAIGAGTVFAAGWNYTGYGISVVIDHHNGYFTHYAHASRLAVHPGQKVAAGQVIAYEGNTGDSTGPHLHFEVHKGMWNQIDPAPWLRAHGVKVGC